MQSPNDEKPKVTYDLVKALIEQNNIDLFATNAKKLLLLAGHGGTGTYQKYLDILRAEHIKAMQSDDPSITPSVPDELVTGLWDLAYATAQVQVAKQLNRVTAERDGLRIMNTTQAADLQMYVEENLTLEATATEYEPQLLSARKAEEVAVNQSILDQERYQYELDRMQSEIKRITDEAIHSKEMMTLSFQIERQTLDSTIDRLHNQLGELKALHIVAAIPSRDKKTALVKKDEDIDTKTMDVFGDEQ